MKITDILNKFLELRKSPAFILFALIGIADLIAIIMLILATIPFDVFFLFYLLFRVYLCFRVAGLPYYITILVIIFIIEKIFKLQINKEFINDRKYINIWLIGIVIAFLLSFFWMPLFDWLGNHI